MGGSLGGLNAALWLRDAECDVEVYERSNVPLAGQGAGIVLNPATVRYFTENNVLDLGEISVADLPNTDARPVAGPGTVLRELVVVPQRRGRSGVRQAYDRPGGNGARGVPSPGVCRGAPGRGVA
jgi:hypothetical protein